MKGSMQDCCGVRGREGVCAHGVGALPTKVYLGATFLFGFVIGCELVVYRLASSRIITTPSIKLPACWQHDF